MKRSFARVLSPLVCGVLAAVSLTGCYNVADIGAPVAPTTTTKATTTTAATTTATDAETTTTAPTAAPPAVQTVTERRSPGVTYFVPASAAVSPDFFGDAVMAGSNYGVILDLEVTRVNSTGETYLSGWEYVPIFILKPEQSNLGGHRVVRIREAMERYELDFVGRITEETYADMEYALERIEKRINPETEE